jgi:hypothetical protein
VVSISIAEGRYRLPSRSPAAPGDRSRYSALPPHIARLARPPPPLRCLHAGSPLKREASRRRSSFSPPRRDFPSPLRRRAAATSLASALSHKTAPSLIGALSSPTSVTASASTPPLHPRMPSHCYGEPRLHSACLVPPRDPTGVRWHYRAARPGPSQLVGRPRVAGRRATAVGRFRPHTAGCGPV